MNPDATVWLVTLAGPAHRPTTNGRTACGLPATTSAKHTRTGIGTTWASVRHLGACPTCWPTQPVPDGEDR